jgi:hypothetical protein
MNRRTLGRRAVLSSIVLSLLVRRKKGRTMHDNNAADV